MPDKGYKNAPKNVVPPSPIKRHGCTDIICTIIMFIFLIVLVVVSVFAYSNGDPSALILPHDSQGRVCGRDAGLEDRPYLFYFDLTRCFSSLALTALNGCPTKQICVAKCPPQTAIGSSSLIKEYCDPFEPTDCPDYLVKSAPVVNRCLPDLIGDDLNSTVVGFDDINQVYEPVQVLNDQGQVIDLTYDYLRKAVDYVKELVDLKNFFQLVLEDLAKSWLFILIALIIGAVLAFLWMILLRFIIKPMVYITIAALLISLAGAAAFCVVQYVYLLNNPTEGGTQVTLGNFYDFNFLKTLKETWLVFAIIAGVLFLIFALIIFFLRKRIKFACEIIKEASKAIFLLPGTLFWPIFPFLLNIGVVFYCLSICLYITSSGVQLFKIVDMGFNTSIPAGASDEFYVGAYCIPEIFEQLQQDNSPDYDNFDCVFFRFGFDPALPKSIKSQAIAKYYSDIIEFLNDYQWLPQVYVLFMFFWLFAFIQGLNQMTIAGSFGTWYFTRYKNIDPTLQNDLPFLTTLGSFLRAIFYHFGTIAFGSLLIAIVKFIRAILEYISEKTKAAQEVSCIVKFLVCCCKCCVSCFERFLKFLNRYAYILCAVYSFNFCSAATKVIKIVVSNPLRMFVLDKISSFLLFLSSLLITTVMGVFSFFFFSDVFSIDVFTSISPSLNYYFLPIIVIILGVFFICKVFFDVFAMGIDTILMCAMIDYDQNDGSEQRPYYMSMSLRKLFKIENRPDPTRKQTTKF